MTPREIIRTEYGNSRNLMTSTVLGIGALPDGAYEYSTGRGIEGGRIWGVSVVRLNDDGTTKRDIDAGRLFHRAADARAYITSLKSATVGE